jgi:hypothetical protein
MDGEAIIAALASCPGSECLKDVLPKPYGTRLKVYNALKTFCEQSQVINHKVCYAFDMPL